MSKKLASLLVKITANGAEAEAVFRQMERKVGDFGKSMTRLGRSFSTYVTAPLSVAAGFAVKVANTQLQSEAKLLNALKGRKDIQDRLIAGAAELQSRTTIGDEAIIEQQAFLAALGLSERQITDTIEAAVQLSAALGVDLESAVKNLAKTYGGLTGELGESIPALKNLTKEELQAGAAIDFVNQNYKGFAETAATTGLGPLQQLKNLFGDLGEQLGVILIPVLQKVVEALKRVVEWLQDLSPETQKWIVGIGAVVAGIGPLLLGLGKLTTSLKGIFALIPLLTTKFTTFAATPLAGMIAGVVALATAWATAAAKQREYLKQIAGEQDLRKQQIYDGAYNKYLNSSDDELSLALAKKQEELDRLISLNEQSRQLRPGQISPTVAERLVAGKTDPYYEEDYDERIRWAEAEVAAINDIIAARRQETQVVTILRETEKDKHEQSLGLLGELQQKLQDLEKLRPFATSEEELAELNAQIADTRREIERLDAVMPTFEKFGRVTADVGAALSSLTSAPKLKAGAIIPIDPVELEDTAETLTATLDTIASSINNAMVSIGTTIGEGIASFFTGEEFDPLKSVLSIIAELLQTVGKALMSYAATMFAVKLALKSMNPWVAAAAGVAAIAAGAVLSSYATNPVKLATGGLAYGPTLAVVGDNPGASSDPEVIAPLSKLSSMLGGQKMELVGDIEFVVSGDTMRAVLNRENVRLSRLG